MSAPQLIITPSQIRTLVETNAACMMVILAPMSLTWLLTKAEWAIKVTVLPPIPKISQTTISGLKDYPHQV